MTESDATQQLILKILNGTQFGAEVALSPGEYSIGSGIDDDIQFVDITLKASHLLIRVSQAKIEAKAQGGSFQTQHGARTISPGDDWQDIEPLDLMIAGTTRFALASPSARWDTLNQSDLFPHSTPQTTDDSRSKLFDTARATLKHKHLWLASAGLCAITVGLCSWLLLTSSGRSLLVRKQGDELETIVAALHHVSSARDLDIHQDIDGTIYATGYVDTLVERRALLQAVEKTAIPVRLRVHVIDVLRSEIDSLIASTKLPISYSLDEQGTAILKGTILSDEAAELFVRKLREDVLGLKQIDSKIKTARSLLRDITDLAKATQIEQVVIFRLAGDVIEANGVIPSSKVDAWVGFLQAYARRFGEDIGIHSFVELQYDPAGPIVRDIPASGSRPVAFGPATAPRLEGMEMIDLDRLKRGEFRIEDVFSGIVPERSSDASSSGDASKQPDTPARRRAIDRGAPIQVRANTGSATLPAATPPTTSKAPGLTIPSPSAPDNPLVSLRRVIALRHRNADPLANSVGIANTGRLDENGASLIPSSRPERRASAATAKPIPLESGGTSTAAPASSASAGSMASAVEQHRPGETGTAPNSSRDMHSLGSSPTNNQAGKNRSNRSPAISDGEGSATGAPISNKMKASRGSGDDLAEMTVALLDLWNDTTRNPADKAAGPTDIRSEPIEAAIGPALKELMAGLDRIAARESSGGGSAMPDADAKMAFTHRIRERMAASSSPQDFPEQACRPGSHLTNAKLSGALFWLDLLMLTDRISIADFDLNAQVELLEAALDPDLVRACERADSQRLIIPSAYLAEVRRNPRIARYVTRSIPDDEIGVTGANLLAKRYIQTSDGRKFAEGSSTDTEHRIAYIGSLGLVLETEAGLARRLYEEDIAWLTSPQ